MIAVIFPGDLGQETWMNFPMSLGVGDGRSSFALRNLSEAHSRSLYFSDSMDKIHEATSEFVERIEIHAAAMVSESLGDSVSGMDQSSGVWFIKMEGGKLEISDFVPLPGVRTSERN